jgi:peptidyl-prolyl cis-trans isomerase B (cyclophilin B)
MKSKTLPDPDRIRRTLIETIQTYRTAILVGIGVVIVVVVAVLIQSMSATAARNEFSSEWSELNRRGRTRPDEMPRFEHVKVTVERLERKLADAPPSDDEVAARALSDIATWSFRAAVAASSEEDARVYLDKAEAAVRRIESEYPETIPNRRPIPLPDSNDTFVFSMLARIEKERAYRAANVYTHPEVDASRYALIETEHGSIKIGFFPELAPRHVENFVTLAKKGFYNDQLVHRVVPDFIIQMGDPNTREHRNLFAKHGAGGPGYSLPRERGRYVIQHRRGIVSTAAGAGRQDPMTGRRTPPLEESGSQFFICVAPSRHLDKLHTPFGEVIEGMEVADAISRLPTMTETFQDHPVRDVVIRSISIWKDGAIEEGHTWDTSIVGTPWTKVTPPPPDSTDDGATKEDDEKSDDKEGDGGDEDD